MGQNQSSLLQNASEHVVSDLPQHPPLEAIQRPLVNTSAAAFYLVTREQTLRLWACRGTGPIRPVRIGGRLRWRTADIKKLIGIA